MKVKRHRDVVTHIQAETDPSSNLLISSSIDNTIRYWSLIDMKMSQKVIINRPEIE